MLGNLWDIFLYEPLVNLLAFLVYIIPGGDIGIAIILLTVLVKAALFPLSQRSILGQAKMALLAPELNKIKASGKSKEEQAKDTFELYKKHKANPFSGCLLMLIQIPIIFALYYVFLRGINFDSGILYSFMPVPEKNHVHFLWNRHKGILYSFMPVPEKVNMIFLGLVDVSQKSLALAILAGISQYFQAHFMPKPTPPTSGQGTFADSFSKSMHIQMKYFFPFLIAFFAYTLSGAIPLYWIANNVFATLQQLYTNKRKHLMLANKYADEQK